MAQGDGPRPRGRPAASGWRPAVAAAESLAEARYQRIVKILELALAATGCTHGELDEGLGHARGFSSRVFAGRGQLKVRDLLRAIEVLGLAPEEMFGPLVLGAASRERRGGGAAAAGRAAGASADERRGRSG
jgi:hypothetical protein